MKKQITLVLVAAAFAFSNSAFAEDAKKEEVKALEVKPENNSKEDPSKTGKKTVNSIFGIPLKQKGPRNNKLLDAGNDLLKNPKKKPTEEKAATETPAAEKK